VTIERGPTPAMRAHPKYAGPDRPFRVPVVGDIAGHDLADPESRAAGSISIHAATTPQFDRAERI